MRGRIPSRGCCVALEVLNHGRIAGHHATGGYEPRQVREEAAVSIAACVMVKSSLTDRDEGLEIATASKEGARPGILFSPD